MGKLIDADTLREEFRRDIMGGLNWDRILREVKTVDAVPVVRCRDCKYWKTINSVTLSKGLKFCTYAIGHDYVRHDEDFCSRGEQKDGDHHD